MTALVAWFAVSLLVVWALCQCAAGYSEPAPHMRRGEPEPMPHVEDTCADCGQGCRAEASTSTEAWRMTEAWRTVHAQHCEGWS